MSSVSIEEVSRFSRDAEDWWNPEGKFRPLHRLNPVRLRYVRDQVCTHFNHDPAWRQPFQGLDVLDVGCGGGLLTEPMTRLGARMTGLDASEEAIVVARRHAREQGLEVEYRADNVEDLARGKKRYDVVTALEIAEHVADLDSFIEALSRLLKPNGMLIMSTLNRTPKSFLLGIVAAEYILRWVPRGTHQWKKFIRPSELVNKLENNGLRSIDLTGLIFNPLTGEFEISKSDLGVNYMLTAMRAN
jgi:2-polyprenyl-6-hydroxyphenyl methylase/3-demethylubiquinone-9 3-methyltransferase